MIFEPSGGGKLGKSLWQTMKMVISVISLLWMGSFCRLQLPRGSPVNASYQREGCEGICLADVSKARSLRVAGAKPDLFGNEVGCRKPKRVDIVLLDRCRRWRYGTCQQARNSGCLHLYRRALGNPPGELP